jgi:hypothetical protein
MFGKKENSIVSTHLIIKVRKYHNLKPSFYLESTIADDTEANSVVEKLNDIAEIQKEENVQEQYYSVQITL